MTISVLSSGITLLQDEGRFGFSEVGVPQSGAFDLYNYQLACALIDNRNAPAFEIFSGTFEITTDQDIVFAIVGLAQVLAAGELSFSGQTLMLFAGQKLTIKPTGNGPTYLVITGLQTDLILGSVSNDSLSGLGPRHIEVGTQFEVTNDSEQQKSVGSFIETKAEPDIYLIRYISGPHEIALTENWRVLSKTRIGIRLDGVIPVESGSANLASFPVMPGCIQVPPSGQPVILGPDCGTTGGYAVAGVVISADLHLLARLKPEQEIKLSTVTLAEAELASQQLNQRTAKAIIRPRTFGAW